MTMVIFKSIWKFASFIFGLIGLFGLPQDLEKMSEFLAYISPYVDNPLVKILSFILLGLLITDLLHKYPKLAEHISFNWGNTNNLTPLCEVTRKIFDLYKDENSGYSFPYLDYLEGFQNAGNIRYEENMNDHIASAIADYVDIYGIHKNGIKMIKTDAKQIKDSNNYLFADGGNSIYRKDVSVSPSTKNLEWRDLRIKTKDIDKAINALQTYKANDFINSNADHDHHRRLKTKKHTQLPHWIPVYEVLETIKQAILLHGITEVDQKYIDMKAARELRQQALEGRIIIRGQAETNRHFQGENHSDIYTEIPKVYWNNMDFKLINILDPHCRFMEQTQPDDQHVGDITAESMRKYYSLEARRDHIEALWPPGKPLKEEASIEASKQNMINRIDVLYAEGVALRNDVATRPFVDSATMNKMNELRGNLQKEMDKLAPVQAINLRTINTFDTNKHPRMHLRKDREAALIFSEFLLRIQEILKEYK